MHWPPSNQSLQKIWVGIAFLLECILGCSLILSANAPTELRVAAVGTCYCHCAESRAHRNCVKMCDKPKHASRIGAGSCVKPRLRRPVENHDAGPRFPHLGRAERAQASEPATDKLEIKQKNSEN
jgi:hypothetical protein